MAPPDANEDALKHVRDSHRAQSRQTNQNPQAVKDGTADPRVYEALEPAYRAADTVPEVWRGSLRKGAETFVTDSFDQAAKPGADFDTTAVSAGAVKYVERSIKTVETPVAAAINASKFPRRWMQMLDTTGIDRDLTVSRDQP